jgi:predicted phage replisome organizer
LNKKRYWLKLKENYFDEDEIMFLKSQKNGYEYIYLWMRLLLKCLKVDEEKDCGILRVNGKVPYDETMIATLFGMNIDVVRVGIKIFQEMGMLEIQEDGTFYIEAVQKMIGKEGESAERMRIHRENKKLLLLSHSGEEVTEGDDNIIRIKEEVEKEIKKEKKEENIIPPTLEMVSIFCKERNNTIDPEAFFIFYRSKGWMIGKNKMVNWHDAIFTWEKRNKKDQPNEYRAITKQAPIFKREEEK